MSPTGRSHEQNLDRLLVAAADIVSDLELSVVLRRIVQAGVDLLGARYGAVGVVGPDGRGLEEFVHVGMPQRVVDRIGHLPEGKGLLGALIADPRPIRTARLAGDHRSAGFPPGHPPMDSFLGVPIRVKGEVFGNLYLTEAGSGEFTAEDESVAVSLAAIAGVAIHNARLYSDSERRQQWLLASSDLTRRVLRDADGIGAGTVAAVVADLADAPLVVVLQMRSAEEATVTAASGVGADSLHGTVLPLTDLLRRTSSTGDARTVDGVPVLPAASVPAGPALVLPLLGPTPSVLVAVRPSGSRAFTGSELEMASGFAAQVSVALELAQAREDQQRMRLLQDRTRIAHDLHDHVIQQLFAAGLTVQGVASTLEDPALAEPLTSVVDMLDDAVRRVRTSIFHLRERPTTRHTLPVTVLETVAELRTALGFEPQVVFAGPLDRIESGPLCDDVVAVVRESLSNVARHADATTARVLLGSDDAQVVLEVEDDGVGIGDPQRVSGLDSMRRRAARHGGVFELLPGGAGRGTLLRWSVPRRPETTEDSARRTASARPPGEPAADLSRA